MESKVNLPPSQSTVILQPLDTTLKLYVRAENFLSPVLPGHEAWNCPTMAFLITNPSNGRRVLFDAGARADYWNYSPVTASRFARGVNVKGMRVDKGVHEVLADAGVELSSLEAVIWSHWHFDHIGDMSQFPPAVKILVGPGFKQSPFLPGYPSNPTSPLLESDYNTHILEEIPFALQRENGPNLRIGPFRAHDYFSDGSFYLLDVPGHAIGHMCGLARTTPTSFVLLGADACHFAGCLRPSPHHPLPERFEDPERLLGVGNWSAAGCICPGEMFLACHPGLKGDGVAGTAIETDPDENGDEGEGRGVKTDRCTTPFYTVSSAAGSAYADPEMAMWSLQGLIALDACEDIWICLAHDPALFEVLTMLNDDPGAEVGDWKKKGLKEMTRWRFLKELPVPVSASVSEEENQEEKSTRWKRGMEPLVEGFWRDGKVVDAREVFAAYV